MSDLFDQPREGDPVWEPSEEYLNRSRLLDFIEQHDLDSYEALLERADSDPSWYWGAVVDHLGLEWFQRYDQVLNLENGLPWPRWFVNGRYNYVHDAVDKHASGSSAGKTAILWEGDGGDVRRLTFAELAAETDRVAAGLRELGIEKGDCVGIFMPMLPETAIATLDRTAIRVRDGRVQLRTVPIPVHS
jgi:acetyl-CoA synthetase